MRRAASTVIAIVLALSVAAPAVADSGGQTSKVEADLAGVSIDIAAISTYYCHDGAFPKIHCFATADGLARALSTQSHGTALQATAAPDYVVIYAGLSYSGASMHLSQDYDTLAVISWNDRVRSFKGLNGERGVFHIDWFGFGDPLAFCCNVQDPSLPTAFDRQITSVYRD